MDAAYVAGFFDGEGTISTQWTKGHRRAWIYVAVCNTNVHVLTAIAAEFGGVLGRTRPGTGGQQDVWKVWWTGRDVPTFLQRILPYLIVKRAQAELALVLSANLRHGHPKGLPRTCAKAETQMNCWLGAAIQRLNKRRITVVTGGLVI